MHAKAAVILIHFLLIGLTLANDTTSEASFQTPTHALSHLVGVSTKTLSSALEGSPVQPTPTVNVDLETDDINENSDRKNIDQDDFDEGKIYKGVPVLGDIIEASNAEYSEIFAPNRQVNFIYGDWNGGDIQKWKDLIDEAYNADKFEDLRSACSARSHLDLKDPFKGGAFWDSDTVYCKDGYGIRLSNRRQGEEVKVYCREILSIAKALVERIHQEDPTADPPLHQFEKVEGQVDGKSQRVYGLSRWGQDSSWDVRLTWQQDGCKGDDVILIPRGAPMPKTKKRSPTGFRFARA